jgi:acyl transferase domain-containing protein/acyl carrier protein
LVSGLTGQMAKPGDLGDPAYWRRHAREAVRFAAAVETLREQGATVFLEVGPSPTLLGLGQRCVPKGFGTWLPSLRKGRDEWRQLLESLGALYAHGVEVDWAGFDRDYPRRRVLLPTYPFERKRYWLPAAEPERRAAPPARERGGRPAGHPLLGRRLRTAGREIVFEAEWSPEAVPFLEGHRFYGMVVVPAAAYAEAALAAAAAAFGAAGHVFEDVAIHQPLILSMDRGQTIQMVLTSESAAEATFQLSSLREEAGDDPLPWTVHASGRIVLGDPAGAAPVREGASLEALRGRCSEKLSVDAYYQGFRDAGVEYGPSFRGIEELWQGDGEALGQVRLPDAVADQGAAYHLHPSLLDACLQTAGAALAGQGSGPAGVDLYMPVGFKRLRLSGRPGTRLWSHVAVHRSDGAGREAFTADLVLFEESGGIVAEVTGVQFKRMSRAAVQRAVGGHLREWFYDLAWRPRARTAREPNPSPAGRGSWIILADRGGVGAGLARRLAEQGERCVVVLPGDAYEAAGDGPIRIDPARPGDFERLLREARGSGGAPPRGVVHLWSLDAVLPEGAPAAALQGTGARCWGSVLHLVQGVVNAPGPEAPRLWLVTRGAQAAGAPAAPALAQAPVWGLANVIALEHPELRCARIDLDPAAEPDASDPLYDEVWGGDREDQIAFRGDIRYVARLVRATPKSRRTGRGVEPSPSQPAAATSADRFRADATYLITGGLGGLGLQVARWMVERGARHLVLVGRRGASGAAREAIQAMERSGARVIVAQADVGEAAQVARVLADIGRDMPPLRGVVHSAGVLDDGVLLQQTVERFATVMAPKVWGGWTLHQLTREMPLDFFVLFSSVASLFGAIGQGNYAAANAFLDGLAHHRRCLGLPALSINWGPWAEVGMAAALQERDQQRRAALGVDLIPPDQGLAALDEVLEGAAVQVAVAPVRWASVLRRFPAGEEPPLLGELVGEAGARETREAAAPARAGRAAGSTDGSRAGGAALLRDLEASPSGRRDRLIAYLRERIGQVLSLEDGEIASNRNIMELGLDSLMVTELIGQFRKDLGVQLYARDFFNVPTVAGMANLLETRFVAARGGEPDRPAGEREEFEF